MSFPIPIWFLFVLWAAYFCLVALPRRRRASRRLPPGPPREHFIGNLRQMPTEKAPLVFHEWARKYGNYAAPILISSFNDSCLISILGDILYLELPGQSIVVLDSLQAAEDLLDMRSAIYSDRPKFRLYELWVLCVPLRLPIAKTSSSPDSAGRPRSRVSRMGRSSRNTGRCTSPI